MKGKGIVLYTLPSCPECEALKKELDRLGIPFTVKNIVADPTSLEGISHERTGWRTLPLITKNGRIVTLEELGKK